MVHKNFKSIQVKPDNEIVFFDYIENNFEEYFFFHADYTLYPESTEIHIVLDSEEKIQGMILIWKNQRVQVRGSIASLEFLLETKNYVPKSITGFDNHKKLISKFFPTYKKEIVLYRMRLKKGDQKDFEKYQIRMLSETHRNEINSLMRIADPIFWGSKESEDILIDVNNIWYGIFEKKKLNCIVNIWKYKNIGYIFIVGTHPDNWNQGYASSLISSALKDLFRAKEYCFIMVRADNAPAIHIYKKLGFLICNTHYTYYEKL